MKSQLTRGSKRRLLYIENKEGQIEGADARIGWATFSKTGQSIHYRGKLLTKATGGGIRGNFFDQETGEEYWVSGVKKRGSNGHWAESAKIVVDDDAAEDYAAIRQK